MKSVYAFDCNEKPDLKTVGGKGLSLILTTGRELPVPPGFVLSTAFFQPWFDQIQETSQWQQFLKTSPGTLKEDCAALKKVCHGLKFDDNQQTIVDAAMTNLMTGEKSSLFAVRSSSPEEDLEGASFAGGYETMLGVKPEGIEQAVRYAFTSCLDERVFLYKQEHGFPVYDPGIAVIIQVQIPSQTAGVAFSLNPLNNCYDEIVINANFGLGESVVSGQVSPDQVVVDKVARRILARQLGKKEMSVWLAEDGGTYEKRSPRQDDFCLSEQQILTLADLVIRVENYYGKPMDIEWAYADNKLYLLQARPITAYIPLVEEMQTGPGEPKKLYLDMLTAKQGIFRAFSALGLDYMGYVQRTLFAGMMGTDAAFDRENGLAFNAGGRSYINMSYTLKMQGQKRAAGSISTQDSLSVEILKNIDAKEYTGFKVPGQLKSTILKAAFKSIRIVKLSLRAFKNPAEYHRHFQEETEKLEQDLKAVEKKELSFVNFVQETTQLFCDYVNFISLPLTYAAEMARSKIKKLFKKEKQELSDQIVYLEQALPNNVTIEMGLALYKLAGFKDILECDNRDEFVSRLQAGTLSGDFLRAWDDFMDKYGHRCPREMDAAALRFYELPGEVYNQLRNLAGITDPANNPTAIYNNGVVKREQTYRILLESTRARGKKQADKFSKYYNVLVTFGAYREIHKYYYIKIIDMFRKRVMGLGETLVRAGRLVEINQVFDLLVTELDAAVDDPSLDLHSLAANNTRFLKKVARIHDFPRLIDSRGRIFHAPGKKAKEGELAGEPISPGTVKGKVKVLAFPDEKPLLPGEILVARATDPGWTPLFLNAGGIVLEVGGLLQHGALVAREYCKPCVAGIEDVTSLLKDGQEIELDGANGIIRFI